MPSIFHRIYHASDLERPANPPGLNHGRPPDHGLRLCLPRTAIRILAEPPIGGIRLLFHAGARRLKPGTRRCPSRAHGNRDIADRNPDTGAHVLQRRHGRDLPHFGSLMSGPFSRRYRASTVRIFSNPPPAKSHRAGQIADMFRLAKGTRRYNVEAPGWFPSPAAPQAAPRAPPPKQTRRLGGCQRRAKNTPATRPIEAATSSDVIGCAST
jgi:hypothetical protein